MRKHHKSSDGKYHINGDVFEKLEGTRAQVYHGTAYKTSGGLLKKDLLQNKNGRIVSKKKHGTAKKEKRLERHGYYAEKGKFGAVRRTPYRSTRKSKSHRKAHTVGGRTRRTRRM